MLADLETNRIGWQTSNFTRKQVRLIVTQNFSKHNFCILTLRIDFESPILSPNLSSGKRKLPSPKMTMSRAQPGFWNCSGSYVEVTRDDIWVSFSRPRWERAYPNSRFLWISIFLQRMGRSPGSGTVCCQKIMLRFTSTVPISTNWFTGCDTWRSWTLPDGVHEPNLDCDRHQNRSFVSKIGQNGPTFRANITSGHVSPLWTYGSNWYTYYHWTPLLTLGPDHPFWDSASYVTETAGTNPTVT